VRRPVGVASAHRAGNGRRKAQHPAAGTRRSGARARLRRGREGTADHRRIRARASPRVRPSGSCAAGRPRCPGPGRPCGAADGRRIRASCESHLRSQAVGEAGCGRPLVGRPMANRPRPRPEPLRGRAVGEVRRRATSMPAIVATGPDGREGTPPGPADPRPWPAPPGAGRRRVPTLRRRSGAAASRLLDASMAAGRLRAARAAAGAGFSSWEAGREAPAPSRGRSPGAADRDAGRVRRRAGRGAPAPAARSRRRCGRPSCPPDRPAVDLAAAGRARP
jgi:hypothetical protein